MADVAAPRMERLAVDELQLDPRNPRLIVQDNPSELALVTRLYEDESLDELVPSFLENGYRAEEPLVVVEEDGRLLVVEGNRRLATLKLLLNPDLRRKARVPGWPTLTAEQIEALTTVPCAIYEHRTQVLTFLGFRHITGPKKWKPFQRARFVAQLIELGQSLDYIQEVIGDDVSATKKLYQDYVAFNQLVDEIGFSADRIRDKFSLLEVMLGQRSIKQYLGMSARLPSAAADAVVPADKYDEFEEVAKWVFGTDEAPPVINDSREINRLLAPVIKDEGSLQYLRRTSDLEGAYERSGGEKEFLLKRLVRVERNIQDISAVLPIYSDDRTVAEAVNRIRRLVDGLTRVTSTPSENE